MTMTNEQLEEAVARLNELHATGNITEMYLIIRQLWAEREAMEKESTEQCRIIGAGGERELALMTKIEEQRREIEKMAAERDRQRAVMAQAKYLPVVERLVEALEFAKINLNDFRGCIYDRDDDDIKTQEKIAEALALAEPLLEKKGEV